MKNGYRTIKSIIQFLVLASAIQLASAQPAASFFPHHVGDRWDYQVFQTGQIDHRFITRDSILADGSHLVFQNTTALYRVDTLAQVYWYPLDTLVFNWLLYKLAADSGDAWENPQSPMLRWAWLARIESAYVFGQRTVVKVFRYGPSPGPSGLEEHWLASRFGLIYTWREPNDITYLRGCVINGDTFGIVTSAPQTSELPRGYVLRQNYPNPFNPVTTIQFDLSEMTLVAIRIYNVLGQQVTVIADGNYPAGNHRIRWNAGGLPSGVYFCRMQANGNIRTIKMLLTK